MSAAFMLAACGEPEGSDGPPAGEPWTVTMGGSASGSSVFALYTAHARLAGDEDGALTVNIRETNASGENLALVTDNAVDFGISGSEVLAQAIDGQGSFAEKPFPDLRMLMIYLSNAEYILVRADSGIDSISDLQGKPFAPGFQGSSGYTKTVNYLNTLGVTVDEFQGGLEDITNAMKDGRIVGFAKSANGIRPDASMLDVASSVPLKAIGFAPDEAAKIEAAYPVYQFQTVPAGTIFDNPTEFTTSRVVGAYFTDTSMADDRAYRLTAALFESLDEAATQSAYAGAQGITAEDTLDLADAVPLHPGAERFFAERKPTG